MKPILFNTPMVEAILAGQKTQTRRVCKPGTVVAIEHGQPIGGQPFYKGDILYVRETWGLYKNQPGVYCYKAGNTAALANALEKDPSHKWRPSIHMPKEAARIFLRVTDVRVERLQESFNAPTTPILAVRAEGVDIGDTCRDCISAYGSPCCVEALDDDGSTLGECGMLDENRGEFSDLWDSTVKKSDLDRYGWAANPWVWVIEFQRGWKVG